jgi:hypothetical protein
LSLVIEATTKSPSPSPLIAKAKTTFPLPSPLVIKVAITGMKQSFFFLVYEIIV